MRTVLVTGCNGFIGSAVAEACAERGDRVVGLIKDRNFKSRRDLLDRITVVYGDLADREAVRHAVSRYEVDTIFHIGALAVLRIAHVDPVLCYSANVMGTVAVLEAARQCKHVRKVVVASSDKSYGTHLQLPYVETMALQAGDTYSTSKACTDLIAQSYAVSYGLNLNIMRSGNVYGPGDLNASRLIPRTILKLLEGEAPEIHRAAMQHKREFMFIEDVVSAYLRVAEVGVPGEAYNIGGAGCHDIGETIRMIGQQAHKLGYLAEMLEPKIVDVDFCEIKHQHLDATKLMALGWDCNYPLAEGLAETIPWYDAYREEPYRLFCAA